MLEVTPRRTPWLAGLVGAGSFLSGATCLGIGTSLLVASTVPLEAVALISLSLAWFVFGERCYQLIEARKETVSN